jgi:hypothetical protein
VNVPGVPLDDTEWYEPARSANSCQPIDALERLLPGPGDSCTFCKFDQALNYQGEIMNTKLLATLVIAALSVPAVSYAQEKKPMTEKVKENIKAR